MNHKEQLMTTSTFAKLCNVTKHTLFHYDEIGILKPAIIGENGYRYYLWRQTATFDLISMLKDSGSSLLEIKSYLENINTNRLISLLEDKKKVVERKLKELHYTKDLIENSIENIKTMDTYPKSPFIEYHKESYYIIEKLTDGYDETEFFSTISQHIRYCKKHLYGDTFFIGFGVHTKKMPLSHILNYDFILSQISKKVNDPNLLVKEAGDYLTYYHKGPYESLSDAYARIDDYLLTTPYVAFGYAFEFEVINYLITNDEKAYITKIIIPVKK